jgi:hypothetical protein
MSTKGLAVFRDDLSVNSPYWQQDIAAHGFSAREREGIEGQVAVAAQTHIKPRRLNRLFHRY